MHAHVQKRRSRQLRATDAVASVQVRSSVERCQGCRAWRLMTTADLAELARAIAAVRRANAEGYCLWCAGMRERRQRKRETGR